MKKFKINYTVFLFLLTAIFSGIIKEVLFMYFILFLHELGHILIIKKYRYEILKITLLPFGAIIECNNVNRSLKEEFLLYISGVSVNILFLITLLLFKNFSLLFYLNLIMLVFNLLPIHPLDGGRLLEVVLSSKLKYKKALLSYVFFSFFICLMAFCFFVVNFININIILLFTFLLFENYLNIKTYEDKYNMFLLMKYLYPNSRLKTKNTRVSGTNLCDNLYKGKNTVINVGKKKIKESEILRLHYKNNI